MRYQKPEITTTESACRLIQHVGKGGEIMDNNPPQLSPPSAYEADE